MADTAPIDERRGVPADIAPIATIAREVGLTAQVLVIGIRDGHLNAWRFGRAASGRPTYVSRSEVLDFIDQSKITT